MAYYDDYNVLFNHPFRYFFCFISEGETIVFFLYNPGCIMMIKRKETQRLRSPQGRNRVEGEGGKET